MRCLNPVWTSWAGEHTCFSELSATFWVFFNCCFLAVDHKILDYLTIYSLGLYNNIPYIIAVFYIISNTCEWFQLYLIYSHSSALYTEEHHIIKSISRRSLLHEKFCTRKLPIVPFPSLSQLRVLNFTKKLI